ncbi:hypothetical protein CHUAL_013259 [Chamberlinius hualienensis]
MEKTSLTSKILTKDDYDDKLDAGEGSVISKSSDEEISNAELGLAEDHFSMPEGHFGLSTIEELEMAIENCKEIILESPESSDRRKRLVKKLVNLRMKLQELKDGPEVLPPDEIAILGHRFVKKPAERPTAKRFCEKCSGNIWGVLHVWYRCKACGFSCHGKCINYVTRMCASVKVHENPSYILDICPEQGLSSQIYRCAECRTELMNKPSVEPRICDYNGLYYCPSCHWNTPMVSPARVLHNWDFEPHKVCRASKQFLQLLRKKAVLNVAEINPMLFSFVEELSQVKKMRNELLVMKKYFLSCKDALENKILLLLSSRQHFVENADIYSMADLEDINSGELLNFLANVHSTFAKHIKEDCEACKGKGYICEVCNINEVIYPFDDNTSTCSKCSSVFHTECFYKVNQMCPKCQRIAGKVSPR